MAGYYYSWPFSFISPISSPFYLALTLPYTFMGGGTKEMGRRWPGNLIERRREGELPIFSVLKIGTYCNLGQLARVRSKLCANTRERGPCLDVSQTSDTSELPLSLSLLPLSPLSFSFPNFRDSFCKQSLGRRGLPPAGRHLACKCVA